MTTRPMNGTPNHPIRRDHLEELERLVPLLAEAALMREGAPASLLVAARRCKAILSDVRWDYGPPESVEVIEKDPGELE